jgi:hypothetical protein
MQRKRLGLPLGVIDGNRLACVGVRPGLGFSPQFLNRMVKLVPNPLLGGSAVGGSGQTLAPITGIVGKGSLPAAFAAPVRVPPEGLDFERKAGVCVRV